MKIILIFLLINSIIIAEIKVKVLEPLSFSKVKNIEENGNLIMGKGYLEINTDSANGEDIGKFVKIEFPKLNLITNKNNWIVVNNISLNEKEKNGVIFYKNQQKVEIRAFIDKSRINSLDNNVEGLYIGKLPISIKIYRPLNGGKI